MSAATESSTQTPAPGAEDPATSAASASATDEPASGAPATGDAPPGDGVPAAFLPEGILDPIEEPASEQDWLPGFGRQFFEQLPLPP